MVAILVKSFHSSGPSINSVTVVMMIGPRELYSPNMDRSVPARFSITIVVKIATKRIPMIVLLTDSS